MGSIQKASEDVVSLFEEVREKTSIQHWVILKSFVMKNKRKCIKSQN